ncbi:MAG: DUF418 domain-containing protein [Cyclobacteriaceae bacterium]
MSDNDSLPTPPANRILSLDFLRGIAVLGILFINIENFAYPDSWSPFKFGFDDPIDRSARFWIYFLTQGKFYTMFALLFGVGFYIFLERLERKSMGLMAMDIYARRLLWLFIIGVGHAYLIWSGDVLYHYAICGLLLFPFRSMRSRYLLVAVAILASLLLVKSYEQTTRRQGWKEAAHAAQSIGPDHRTDKENRSIEFWNDKLLPQLADTSHHDAPKSTYWMGLTESYKHASVHKGMLYYQGLLFPSLIVMIIGIVLYRSGIFSDYRNWSYYWPMSISFLFIGLLINYDRYHHWTYDYFNPILSIWRGWLHTFPKETLGIAYVLILNGLFQKLNVLRRASFISQVGRMALTNYIFQNIVLGLIFYGYGLAQFNQWSRFELLGIVLGVWVVQIVLSAIWLQNHQQGPLEYLWRKLTYSSFREK